MEPSAILELIAGESAQVDSSFEYWLAASFAVVVAAHVGRGSFTASHRHMLSCVYLLFCVTTLTKFWADTDSISYYASLLQGTEFTVNRTSNIVAGLARVVMYLVGSVLVTAFIYQARSMAGDTGASD